MHAAFGVGAFFSPLAIRWAMAWSPRDSYAAAFWSFSAAMALTAIALSVFPTPESSRSSAPPTGVREEEEDGQCKAAEPRERDQLGWWGLVPRDLTIVALAAAILGLYVGAETGFGGYVLFYAHRRLGFSQAKGQYLTGVFWGSLAAGRILAIPLSLRLAPAHQLYADLLVSTVAMAGIVMLWRYRGVLWFCTGLFGLGMASVYPTVMSFVEEFINVTGRISSTLVVGAAIGEMVIPLVLGLATSVWPPAFPLLLLLTLVGCSAATAALHFSGTTAPKYLRVKTQDADSVVAATATGNTEPSELELAESPL